uniref:Uncharacterized protein n=1 Tax=Anguilla anguilla TaxID=7936 RepID=A0A0E9Q0M7_ANGAN
MKGTIMQFPLLFIIFRCIARISIISSQITKLVRAPLPLHRFS